MRRTFGKPKHRADLDDEPDPAWVTETNPRIPTCIKCGAKVPKAKSLHTICAQCSGSGEIVRRHDVHALIRQVITHLDADRVEQLVKQYGQRASDERVRHHAERLIGRGLEGAVAYRQAESMVRDPVHLAQCAVCQEQPPEGPG